MTEITITSLTEFINEITTLNDFYYRGESQDYGNTKLMSSAYRQIGKRKSSEIISLREKYYREIGISLSLMETENFIAYAQHHGLPTELIDITSNPLVALYFACCDSLEEDGFVYAIDSNDTVYLDKRLIHEDISKQKIDFNFKFNWFKNTMFHDVVEVDSEFEKLLLGLSEKQEELFDYLYKYVPDIKKKLDSANKYLGTEEYFPIDVVNGVNSSINNLFMKHGWMEGIQKLNARFNETIIKNSIYDLKYAFRNEVNRNLFSNHFWEIDYYREFRDEAFALLILALAIDLKINPLGTNSSTSVESSLSDVKVDFPPIKYFVHQPSVIFDRMKNQQGLFIYQISVEDHRFNRDTEVVQPLIPKCTFQINRENKESILEQLDKVGISRKFIYPDHDNIACYVKNKWKEA